MDFAGYVAFNNRESPSAACRQGLARLPHLDLRVLDQVAFARGGRSMAEVEAGAPAAFNDDLLLVGDVALFDKSALRARIGSQAEALGIDRDSSLLLLAWNRWGEDCLAFVRGDFAFAVWDRRTQRLSLVRGPLAASSLYYFRTAGGVAIASDRTTLLAITGVNRAIDFDTAGRFMAGLPFPGERTMFAGIRRLNHSHIITVATDHWRERAFWVPRRQDPRRESIDDLASELESRLEDSIRQRTRDRTTLVTSQLSSGRDSGSVTVTTARLLGRTNESLLALTAAPASPEYEDLEGWIGDESELASATARMYPNIDHQVVRSTGNPLHQLEEAQAILPNPVGHLSNFPWGRDLHLAARARGSALMLTGGLGNLTVSAGGLPYLSAVLREEGWTHWSRLARSRLNSPSEFLKIANQSFGVHFPAVIHRWARWLVGRTDNDISGGARFLRPAYRKQLAHAFRENVAELRPPRDAFERQSEMIMAQDPTDHLSRALWGVAVRDPTADRDLIDFCFAIPADMLIGKGDSRPLFDRAFAGRLGWSSGGQRPRGHQGADWNHAFDRSRTEELLGRYRNHEIVREILDLKALDALVEGWPVRWQSRSQMHLYRNYLLGAVSLAQFIAVNF